MQIKIKTTNIELTDAISAYVEEKIQSVEKFTVSHEEEEVLAEVEVGRTTKRHNSGDIFHAEVNIHDVRDELVRELNSHKTKERTLMRRGAGMIKDLLRFGRENN
jgi:ribosomal subunit interface protein